MYRSELKQKYDKNNIIKVALKALENYNYSSIQELVDKNEYEISTIKKVIQYFKNNELTKQHEYDYINDIINFDYKIIKQEYYKDGSVKELDITDKVLPLYKIFK